MPPRRLLVTGATGFIGSAVLAHFRKAGGDLQLWATSERPRPKDIEADEYRQVDLRDAKAVRKLVSQADCTDVIHLAGLMGPASMADLLEVNVLATENLLQALAGARSAGYVRIVQTSSASVYGLVSPDDLPVNENKPFGPLTPYALSKAAQDALGRAMWVADRLQVVTARIFNTIGPGQGKNLVPMTFVKQLKDIETGRADRLRVGSTSSRRDFVDVRDIASALDALLERGKPGGVYNVASGRDTSIQEIIDELLRLSGVDVPLEVAEDRVRPVDVPCVRADVSRIAADTGWRAEISWRRSLADMWRSCA